MALPLLVFSQKKSKYETWIVTEVPSLSGEIIEFRPSSILFKVNDEARTYQVSEIEKIKFIRERSRERGALRGVLIGGGAGFIIGAGIDFIALNLWSTQNTTYSARIGGTLVGSFSGALIGAAIGSDKSSIFIKKSQKNYDKNRKRLKKLIGTEQ